ncbi:ArgS-related anticodon-binding protein NrtL [Streptomyces genisteinicus]|uniref:arginine--tRNA ligase n=1 Tax=Streptomyces genisteinicus TaxID=2768068 RepID=A0A7H0HXN3_9ACTN|nr:arginine--tRNA ligase [Streptomyces genisteinicus]QNP65299.1 arginine--tRNA ligase [Streptomyces genisteinicus]
MTPAELSRTVARAVCRAVEEGALAVEVPEPASVRVERPRPGGTGDWATGIALKLAGPAGRPPREVAGVLGERIARAPGIERVEITGPGFLNVTLEGSAQQRLVAAVRAAGAGYGMPAGAAEGSAPGTPGVRPADAPAPAGDASDRPEAAQAPGPPHPALGDHPAPRDHPAPQDRAALWAEVLGRMGAAPVAAAPRPVPARPGLVAELGEDAARWAMLSAAAHDRPRTGDLLVQHERNPLFTVRYAHARARALTRGAGLLGFAAAPEEVVDAPVLTQAIADFPVVVADAARLRAPDRLARHLEATAEALLAFQHGVLPVGDEKPSAAHRSRLALAEAAGTVLAGGLSLLGISAPEHL